MPKERITPPHILKAKKTGDIEALRRGAERSNQIQKAKRLAAEESAEKQKATELDITETLNEIEAEERKLKILEEELERQLSTNEYDYPVFGERLKHLEDDDYGEYPSGTQL